MSGKKEKIIIVGAGLCGSLLAIKMAQRGFEVAVYESRPDMRKHTVDAGRSINLALSARGLMALDAAQLAETVLQSSIPMRGRLIHPIQGDPFLSPYSGRPDEHINSVSRSGLNTILLEEAEKHETITLHFEAPVSQVDLKEGKIGFLQNGEKKNDRGAIIIGTDGAGSIVRRSMMLHTQELLFNYSQDFLRHGYKELSILPAATDTWQIEKEALHIWPRGDFMIIALPNLDGSFTLTMFHPFDGEVGFNNLTSADAVNEFFEAYYPTLLPYIPHYQKEYFTNPVGNLGTIKCYPWQAFGKALIMGDAAHAIVPFYGQGMNCSFEDVRVFDETVNEYGTNWNKILESFQERRAENTNAIADLAIDNFYEMRDKVNDQVFIRKRKVEMQLEAQYADYFSKYSTVTFNPKMSYAEAMKRGRKQDEVLLTLCKRDDYEQIPLQEYYKQCKEIQL